jgi:hypothetical protein
MKNKSPVLLSLGLSVVWLGLAYGDDLSGSNQDSIDPGKFIARASSPQSSPSLKISNDDQTAEPGKPYVTAQIDGTVGTGIRMLPSVKVKVSQPYLVSFWLKTSGTTQITYRVTDLSGEQTNESTPAWHAAPPADNTWAKAHALFFPVSSVAGLEIAAGQRGAPMALSVCDARIVPAQVDADSGVSFDFSTVPDVWHGRPSTTGGPPSVTAATDPGSEHMGKPSLTLKTDGKVGSGFQLDPVVKVTPDNSYILTFWFRTSSPVVTSFRISGAEGKEYGEATPTWHSTPVGTDQWTRVDYKFKAVGRYIGIEMGEGEVGNPFQFSVSNVSIAPQ